MVVIRYIALLVLGISLGILIAVSVQRSTGERAALQQVTGIKKNEYASYKFDKVRELVNAHSAFSAGGGKADRAAVADATLALYRYAMGGRRNPPALSSAVRAGVFARLLKVAGYEARTVTLLQPEAPYYVHSLVEVYNPRTRGWELQDQDYNVYYTFKGSAQRVSLADMLSHPIDNFVPCHMEGDCNWLMISPEGLNVVDLRPDFAAAVIKDGARLTLVLNAARFDLEKSGLCDREPVLCNGRKIIY